MKYFDAHTHIQFVAYDEDRDEVIKRALEAGIFFVNVGTQKDTSAGAAALAEKYDGVYATVGLHPIHTDESYHDSEELGGETGFTSRGEEFDYEYYKKLALNPKVVAIGECGLDYYRLKLKVESCKLRQKDAFLKQINLSNDIKKPLMIHCREAFPDLIKILDENKNLLLPENPGIVHFFSGTADEARNLLVFGFSFTFGGVITFTRDYDEVVRMVPLDRILSETDAPYVAPAPFRGKRNEPAYVPYVVKKLAEIKGIPEEDMRQKVLENAERVFGVGDWTMLEPV